MEIRTIMKPAIECMKLNGSDTAGLRSSLVVSNYGSTIRGID